MSAQPITLPRPAANGRSCAKFDCLFGAPELSGPSVPFERNSEIYGEGEPADYVYKVIRGAVRTCKNLSDGRRQINGFYFAGDIFGLEGDGEHAWSAEAVVNCKILMVKRSLVMSASQRDAEVGHGLWAATVQELQRAQNHALLLIKSAQERVATFLLELAHRLPCSSAVDLMMSRQDIADYLGLTIETVSRTLTQLQGTSTIELLGARRIVLRNPSVLDTLNS
jgi:CRP-like cAMP-binding protein